MMLIPFSVTNYTPALGPVQNGKQTVSVYDNSIGNRRTVVATEQEVDRFLMERDSVMKDGRKKDYRNLFVSTVAGIATGVLIAMSRGKMLKSIDTKIDGLLGGLFGMLLGSLPQKERKADIKITNEFIQAHK